MNEPPKRPKKPLKILLAFIGVLIFIDFARNVTPKTVPNFATHYDKNRVCPDAWNDQASRVNQYDEEDIPYFDVTLRDGCFSGYVRRPNDWQYSGEEFLTNDPNDYIAFWYNGWPKPSGPWGPHNIPDFRYVPGREPGSPYSEFRLQGHGTVRFYKIK